MANQEKKYYTLGSGAASFHDPKTGLNLAGKEVGVVLASLAINSKALNAAVKNGHIKEVEETQYNKANLKAPVSEQLKASEEAQQDLQNVPNVKNNDGKETTTGNVSPNGPNPGMGGAGGQSNTSNVLDDDDMEDEDEEDEEDEDDDDVKSKSKASKKKSKK